MSWNDPCSGCGNPRRDCSCKYEPPKIRKKPPVDTTARFKVMEEMFFGGKICIGSNLSFDEARKIENDYDGDCYSSRYVLYNDVPSNLIYDYPHRI